MGPLSALINMLNTVKNIFSWTLKIFNHKIVKINEYQDETIDVKFNYPEISSKCIEEKKKGATFAWSKTYKPDYEKYSEISGNTRRFFRLHNQHLWIKKSKEKNS